VQGALENGRASDERWHLRKDGSRFWGSGSLMSMHDAQQSVIGFVKIFRDQTDERAAREAWSKVRRTLAGSPGKRQGRKAAEAASHAKDQFLAMLSHEPRTPLRR